MVIQLSYDTALPFVSNCTLHTESTRYADVMNVKFEYFLYLKCIRILRHFIVQRAAIASLLPTQPGDGSSLYFKVCGS